MSVPTLDSLKTTMRASKLWHDASGFILWMNDPAQHSTVRQLYAHDFEAHALLYGAQKGCEPVHVQPSPLDAVIDLINHTIIPLNGITVSAIFYNLDGTVGGRQSHTLDAAANARTRALKLLLPEKLSDACFVRLAITDATGAGLGDNFFWPARQDGNLHAINRMSPTTPTLDLVLRKVGTMYAATATLQNHSHTPAIAIKLTPRKQGMTGPESRSLPAFISDNYFSLMPGEAKTATLEFHQEDARGHLPTLEISGWNIPSHTRRM